MSKTPWQDFLQAFFYGLAPAKKTRPASPQGYIGLAASFGFGLVIRLYLAFLAGSWLDKRFDIAPYGLLAALLAALYLSFRNLFRLFPKE
jgi:hypothetical protein